MPISNTSPKHSAKYGARILMLFCRRAGKTQAIPGVLKGLKDIIAQNIISYVTTFLAIVHLSFRIFIVGRLIGKIRSMTTSEFGKKTLRISAKVSPQEFVKLLLCTLIIFNLEFLSLLWT